MVKFSHERENPENFKKRIIENAGEKIKRIIYEEGLKITPIVEEKLKEEVGCIDKKNDLAVSENEILKNALEDMFIEQGCLPETLEKFYIDLIAKEITNQVAAGENFYRVLGSKMKELKRKGIEIDSKKVEEKIRDKI